MRAINYISIDKQSGISSYGQEFIIGEEVGHQQPEAGTSLITSFEEHIESNEVKAHTKDGWAHLDFLVKLNN